MGNHLAVVVCLVVLMSACATGGESDNTGSSGCSGHSCYITMTDSGGHLNASANVGLMVFTLPSCSAGSITGGPSLYFRSGASNAILGFALNPAFFGSAAAGITLWIDSDDSQNLNPGDWTWGTSSTIQTIFCAPNLATLEDALPVTFDWTATGQKYAGGTRQWTGESKPYAVDPPWEHDGVPRFVVAVDTLAAD